MSLETIVFFALGLGLLVGGADLLVRGASRLAAAFGISPLVIGLTVVAYGTSSPEMAVSVKSAFSGQADIAVGNAVGSNIFNLFGVLGLGALVSPGGISVPQHILQFDFPVMVFVALVSLPIFYIDNRISKLEGALLVAYYTMYMCYLILQAAGSSFVNGLTLFIMFFTPATFIGLVVFAFRSSRAKRAG